MIRVTVWNEYYHEREDSRVAEIYPKGIHGCIADFLGREEDITVRTAVLDDPDNGLPASVLAETDVLIWWGHMHHNDVSDETVDRVVSRVLDGMGLIVLHSGHASKVFSRLIGTRTWDLKWRESNDRCILWVTKPGHPILKGIEDRIELRAEETYGEPFTVAEPDETLFISWFEGGEVFRSGLTYTRGNGRIFYFQPGHETYPAYYNPQIQRVIVNAVRWAAEANCVPLRQGHIKVRPIEDMKSREV